jgi:hypothetical protein
VSDIVVVALIAGAPGLVAAVLGFINNILARNSAKHFGETKVAMEKLEKNTNSIKDELVKSTAEGARAKGNLEGRAELKAENEKGTRKPKAD